MLWGEGIPLGRDMIEDVSIVLLVTLMALAVAGLLRVSFVFAGETNITTNVRATANTGGNNASGGNPSTPQSDSGQASSEQDGSGGTNGAPGSVVVGGSSASVEVHQTVNGVVQQPVVAATSSRSGSANVQVDMRNDGQGRTVQTSVSAGGAASETSTPALTGEAGQASDRRGTASGTGGGVPQNVRGAAALARVLSELVAVLRSFSLSLLKLFP